MFCLCFVDISRETERFLVPDRLLRCEQGSTLLCAERFSFSRRAGGLLAVSQNDQQKGCKRLAAMLGCP